MIKSIFLVNLVLFFSALTATAAHPQDIQIKDLPLNVSSSIAIEIKLLRAQPGSQEHAYLSELKQRGQDPFKVKMELDSSLLPATAQDENQIIYDANNGCQIELSLRGTDDPTNIDRNILLNYSGKLMTPEEATNLSMMTFKSYKTESGNTFVVNLVCYRSNFNDESSLSDVENQFNEMVRFRSL